MVCSHPPSSSPCLGSKACSSHCNQNLSFFCTRNAHKRLWHSFIPVKTNLYDRESSYAAENVFMPVWKDLSDRECFYETNCWQGLIFENSGQSLNRNVHCAEHFDVVMTHLTAKANLEKGSSWPQRPCHMESRSVLTTSSPTVRTHTLDPTSGAPRP